MNRKFLLLLTVICLALLVGCAADKMAADSTVSKFWNGWRDLEKSTILDTLADQVEHETSFMGLPLSSTMDAGAIADTYTDTDVYWEGCTDRKFVISKTTEYRESKLIIVESQASWMKDGDQVKYNLSFTLSKIDSRWRINKIKYVLM
jgi:hypothetical protein